MSVGTAEGADAVVSTSLRSMTMAAMSRVNRTRPPLAETSKLLADVGCR